MEASFHLMVVCVKKVQLLEVFGKHFFSENLLRGRAWRIGPVFGYDGETNGSGSRGIRVSSEQSERCGK